MDNLKEKDCCKDFSDYTCIQNKQYEGERPLYAQSHLYLNNITILNGESAIKECSDIIAENCTFNGKYPFWETDGMTVKNCLLQPGSRAGIWYSKNASVTDTVIDAPKIFREMDYLKLVNVKFSDAAETLWFCRNVDIKNVEAVKGDYIFLNCSNVLVDNFRLDGNYSFQYAKNVEIRNSKLNTKDAFWNTENITVYDSEINGEYLGWYSKNLKLINCHISGTQPLCYAENLVLENCTFGEDADLAFEYSTVNADVKGHIASVKNPTSGSITADSIGEIIIDKNQRQPADCVIKDKSAL